MINAEKIHKWLAYPEQISEADRADVEVVTEKYPYFLPAVYLEAILDKKIGKIVKDNFYPGHPYVGNWMLFHKAIYRNFTPAVKFAPGVMNISAAGEIEVIEDVVEVPKPTTFKTKSKLKPLSDKKGKTTDIPEQEGTATPPEPEMEYIPAPEKTVVPDVPAVQAEDIAVNAQEAKALAETKLMADVVRAEAEAAAKMKKMPKANRAQEEAAADTANKKKQTEPVAPVPEEAIVGEEEITDPQAAEIEVMTPANDVADPMMDAVNNELRAEQSGLIPDDVIIGEEETEAPEAIETQEIVASSIEPVEVTDPIMDAVNKELEIEKTGSVPDDVMIGEEEEETEASELIETSEVSTQVEVADTEQIGLISDDVMIGDEEIEADVPELVTPVGEADPVLDAVDKELEAEQATLITDDVMVGEEEEAVAPAVANTAYYVEPVEETVKAAELVGETPLVSEDATVAHEAEDIPKIEATEPIPAEEGDTAKDIADREPEIVHNTSAPHEEILPWSHEEEIIQPVKEEEEVLQPTNKKSAAEEMEQLIQPVYAEDYFRHVGVSVSDNLPGIDEDKEEDKSLLVMMSFSEWLQHLKLKTLKEKEEETEKKALRTMWKKEKLAAALEEENEEIPEQVFEMAVNSIVMEDGMISESLAEIYTKQGKYDKAIEMYNKLSLRNPQKSTYFAIQIEKIKKQKES